MITSRYRGGSRSGKEAPSTEDLNPDTCQDLSLVTDNTNITLKTVSFPTVTDISGAGHILKSRLTPHRNDMLRNNRLSTYLLLNNY